MLDWERQRKENNDALRREPVALLITWKLLLSFLWKTEEQFSRTTIRTL